MKKCPICNKELEWFKPNSSPFIFDGLSCYKCENNHEFVKNCRSCDRNSIYYFVEKASRTRIIGKKKTFRLIDFNIWEELE